MVDDIFQNLKKIVNFETGRFDLVISLSCPVVPIFETKKRRSLLLGPIKQRGLSPRRHDLLDVLHVVFGCLKSLLKVVNSVPRVDDVVPCTWQESLANHAIEVHWP